MPAQASPAEALGYDGKPYRVGNRVELSPHLDLWWRGATHGVVRSIGAEQVAIRSDHPQVKTLIKAPADCFRIVR